MNTSLPSALSSVPAPLGPRASLDAALGGESPPDAELGGAKAPAPVLPVIEVTSKVADVIDACVAALARAPRLNLFVRDQALVQILRSSDPHGGKRDGGAPLVRLLTPATLR